MGDSDVISSHNAATNSALASEYIKLARIKGLSETLVVWKHALRNSLLPVLTYMGAFFATKLYKLNLLTIGDYYRERYGKGIEVFCSVAIILSYLGWVAAQITALGLTNREAAARLGVSVHAVKFHLAAVYRKLHVANRTQAVATFLSAQSDLRGD